MPRKQSHVLRNKLAAIRVREKRANETLDQRRVRLDECASRYRSMRAQESEEARLFRLADIRRRAAACRARKRQTRKEKERKAEEMRLALEKQSSLESENRELKNEQQMPLGRYLKLNHDSTAKKKDVESRKKPKNLNGKVSKSLLPADVILENETPGKIEMTQDQQFLPVNATRKNKISEGAAMRRMRSLERGDRSSLLLALNLQRYPFQATVQEQPSNPKQSSAPLPCNTLGPKKKSATQDENRKLNHLGSLASLVKRKCF